MLELIDLHGLGRVAMAYKILHHLGPLRNITSWRASMRLWRASSSKVSKKTRLPGHRSKQFRQWPYKTWCQLLRNTDEWPDDAWCFRHRKCLPFQSIDVYSVWQMLYIVVFFYKNCVKKRKVLMTISVSFTPSSTWAKAHTHTHQHTLTTGASTYFELKCEVQ